MTVSVANTAWMVVGQTLFINTGGYYTVFSIGSGTSVTLTNTGDTGNAAATTSIPSGSGVSPGGVQGATGPGGPSTVFTGRGTANLASNVTNNWFINDAANATASEGAAQTLNSNTQCTAQNLSVKLTLAPGGTATVKVAVRANGADVISCTVGSAATTCTSGATTGTIAAGAAINIQITTAGGNIAGTQALWGVECRP